MVRHRVNKLRLTGGKSSNAQLMRSLVRGFIATGKLVSTKKRVRVVRSRIEILVGRAKGGSQADNIYVQRMLGDNESIRHLKEAVVPVFADRIGGYVRSVSLTARAGDAADIARLEWTKPVITVKKQDESAEKAAKGKKTESKAKATKAVAKESKKSEVGKTKK